MGKQADKRFEGSFNKKRESSFDGRPPFFSFENRKNQSVRSIFSYLFQALVIRKHFLL
jgi:hypothetical protein